MKSTSTSLSNIRCFRAIGDNVGTAGQPNHDQFEMIRTAGYVAVINLAMPTSPNAIPNEKNIVESLGMSYLHIPVDFDAPTVHDFDAFSQAMTTLDGEMVFVHCAANMRVSAFVFLYRVTVQGLAVSEAEPDLHTIWHPNETWSLFIQDQMARSTQKHSA